jgi:DNA-binding CsgD family transcriptional regulator
MPDIDDGRLNRTCDRLYEAATASGHWPDALAELASIFGADSAHFTVWNRSLGRAEVAVTARDDPKSEATYATAYGQIDPCRKLLNHEPIGNWITNDERFGKEVLERHPYYKEFLKPLGFLFVAKCRVNVSDNGDRCSIFGLARKPDAEPFETSRLVMIARKLNPHLGRAATLHDKLAPAMVSGRLTEAALDRLPTGVLLVSAHRRVLFANKAGATVLEGSNGLKVQNGLLHASDPAADQELAALTSHGEGGWLSMPRGTGTALHISIAPLPEAANVPSTAGDRSFLILLSDTERTPSLEMSAALRKLYRLTAAEARIACLLADGFSLSEIAEKLGTSKQTARTQLKAIFEKMGVSRQSDLVAAISGLDRIRITRT